MKNEILIELYKSTIKQIKAVQELTKNYNMLDSQKFLDFQDSLNELSLDPER